MLAARAALLKSRKRMHNQVYRGNLTAKLRHVTSCLSSTDLPVAGRIQLELERDELRRKMNHSAATPLSSASGASVVKRPRLDSDHSCALSSTSSEYEESEQNIHSESGIESADHEQLVVDGEEGSEHEHGNQEHGDQEHGDQEQENNDSAEDGFGAVHLRPFSPSHQEQAAPAQQDKDSILEMRHMSRRELSAMLLAAKVKEHYSESSSITHRVIMNSIMLNSTGDLETGIHKHKEYLRRMCPIPRDWVFFCYQCGVVAERRRIRPERANAVFVLEDFHCRECEVQISSQVVKAEHCKFIVCGIRAQIESFLKGTYLPILLERSASIARSTSDGEMHKNLKYPDFFDLTLACDAAPITKKSKVNIFPCMLFFNNIPPNYQLRFPILGGIFSGPSDTIPPVIPFFQEIRRELDDLAENPITWMGTDGTEYKTKVFVTISQNDSKQKAIMLNLNDTAGRYSCPYCYERGEDVRSGDYRVTTLVHSTSAAPWRTEQDYLRLSDEAASLVAAGQEVDVEETLGAKGYPVLHNMPHFEAIWSTTPDTLHVVYEGVLKKIVHTLCKGKDQPNGILKRNEDFSSMFILLII